MQKIKIKKVKNKKDYNKTIKIREIVFIAEQKVSRELEMDGLDKACEHFIVNLINKPIGCARIRKTNDFIKLERIAILKKYRGKGFGRELTNFLIKYCKDKGFNKIYLHSQLYISDFYKKLGFKKIGKKFLEANIEHIKMILKI